MAMSAASMLLAMRRCASMVAASAGAGNARGCIGHAALEWRGMSCAPLARRQQAFVGARNCDAAPRAAMCSSSSSSSSGGRKSGGEGTIRVVFVDRDGDEYVINDAEVGESMLEVAHANDVELEGACEGSLACSTCHVIVEDEDVFDGLPEATDDENDMLDLAFGLTETSRLGCQIIAKKEIDGIRLKIPSATRNFAVDGFVPKPH